MPIARCIGRTHTLAMRITILIFALLLQAATAQSPAFAQMCDTRCDKGEVWSEEDGGTCVPDEPKTS
jgi:hypothetical protein